MDGHGIIATDGNGKVIATTNGHDYGKEKVEKIVKKLLSTIKKKSATPKSGLLKTLKVYLNDKSIDLGMALPKPNDEALIDPISIEVQTEGVKINGGDLESLAEVKKKLSIYKRAADTVDAEPVVVISANDDVKASQVVDLLNILKDVEIVNVTMKGFSKE